MSTKTTSVIDGPITASKSARTKLKGPLPGPNAKRVLEGVINGNGQSQNDDHQK